MTYIDVSAVSAGLPNDFSFYLVAIASAASGLGRFAGGALADIYGPINIMIPATICAAALTYAWPFAKTQGDFVVVAIIYGIFSGVYVSLLTAPIMAMGNVHNVGMMVGVSMTILAFGAIAGPPISGAINDATGGFKAVGYYAGPFHSELDCACTLGADEFVARVGSTVILAVVLIVITRQFRLGGKLYGKV